MSFAPVNASLDRCSIKVKPINMSLNGPGRPGVSYTPAHCTGPLDTLKTAGPVFWNPGNGAKQIWT